MSNHPTLLHAIDSDLTNDAPWLAYADWLDHQQDWSARILKKAIDTGVWTDCRFKLFRKLPRRQRRLFACDCVERILPIYERRYPDDARPRHLVDTLRRYATGLLLEAAQLDVAAASETAAVIANADPSHSLAAYRAVQVTEMLVVTPSNACLNAAYLQAMSRYGPEVLYINPKDSQFKPEWRLVVDNELRWQIARNFRYRFDPASLA